MNLAMPQKSPSEWAGAQAQCEAGGDPLKYKERRNLDKGFFFLFM